MTKSYNLKRWDIFDMLMFDIENGLSRYDHPRPRKQSDHVRHPIGCECIRCAPSEDDMTEYTDANGNNFLTY